MHNSVRDIFFLGKKEIFLMVFITAIWFQTHKIWLFILPSSCFAFPCKLVTRIWCWRKKTTSTWWIWVFLLPSVWGIMCRYYRENLHVNYFLELKGQLLASCVFFILFSWPGLLGFWGCCTRCSYTRTWWWLIWTV